MTDRALDFSVIELTDSVAGAYCGRLLAGFGAEVVKVEQPGAGDLLRAYGPFPDDQPDPEQSGLFHYLNAGKQSVALDIESRVGAQQLRDLIASADVAIVGLRPEEAEARGLSYASLSRGNPGLVMTSVTHFGLTGPYRDLHSTELTTFALSGYMSLTGLPEREPLKAWGFLGEYTGGVCAALGTLSALRARAATGEGQLVDHSILESMLLLLGMPPFEYRYLGKIYTRAGNDTPGVDSSRMPSKLLPARDGYVQTHRGHAGMLALLTGEPRLEEENLPREEYDAMLLRWLAGHDKTEVAERAQELRMAYTEVRAPSELLLDPQHVSRGLFDEVEHPIAGSVTLPGAPFNLHGAPWRTRRAPLLGEHTAELTARPPRRRTPHGAVSGEQSLPYAGVRILDLGTLIAAPIATQVLADLGAEVIKIEPPHGDYLRGTGGPVGAPRAGARDDRPYNRRPWFNELNRGKLGVALDLSDARGVDLFKQLVRVSDIVIENFSPRVMENLGLTYPLLRAEKADLIMLSVSAFGATGPYRDRLGFGPTLDAASGITYLTGYAGGPPIKPGNYFSDFFSGMHAALAIMIALERRARSGEGTHVDLAMREVATAVVADAAIEFAMNGRAPTRRGNRHPSIAPHGCYPCTGADRWVTIAVRSDEEWRRFAETIGGPRWAADARFTTASGRLEHEDELDARIARWTASRDPREVMGRLQQAGVPSGAVLNVAEVLADPQVVARGAYSTVTHPELGEAPIRNLPWTLSRTPVAVQQPSPMFGQHNRELLQSLLGMPAAAIDALYAAGVLTDEL